MTISRCDPVAINIFTTGSRVFLRPGPVLIFFQLASSFGTRIDNVDSSRTDERADAFMENRRAHAHRSGMERVASLRFELKSQDPESRMIDRYTTRLSKSPQSIVVLKPICLARFRPHGVHQDSICSFSNSVLQSTRRRRPYYMHPTSERWRYLPMDRITSAEAVEAWGGRNRRDPGCAVSSYAASRVRKVLFIIACLMLCILAVGLSIGTGP